MDDPALVGRVHGLGQGRQQRGGLAGRLRRARSFWARLPPSTNSMVKYGRPSWSPTS